MSNLKFNRCQHDREGRSVIPCPRQEPMKRPPHRSTHQVQPPRRCTQRPSARRCGQPNRVWCSRQVIAPSVAHGTLVRFHGAVPHRRVDHILQPRLGIILCSTLAPFHGALARQFHLQCDPGEKNSPKVRACRLKYIRKPAHFLSLGTKGAHH